MQHSGDLSSASHEYYMTALLMIPMSVCLSNTIVCLWVIDTCGMPVGSLRFTPGKMGEGLEDGIAWAMVRG